MPKPDKVLRFRPLKEVKTALAKLQRVVLFHPKPLDEKLPSEYCYCKKGERKTGTKSKSMVQCVSCWQWYHFDCCEILEGTDLGNVEWKCGWCLEQPDKLGCIGGFLLGSKRANCGTGCAETQGRRVWWRPSSATQFTAILGWKSG
jgi:hypothetical protein